MQVSVRCFLIVTATLLPAVGGPGSTSGDLELPEGVTIAVEFPRYLRLARDLEVIVDNQSDTDIVVAQLALRSPLFEDIEATGIDNYLVRDHWRTDFRIDFGAAICPPPEQPSLVEMAVEIDGEPMHGAVEIDPAPLQRISDDECGQRLVFETADIAISDEYAVDGDVLTTTIGVARRQGDEPITITAIRGAILYGLEPAEVVDPDVPLASLGPDENATSIPVLLRVIRCDPHAAADIKIPFAFSAWVTIGDRPSQHITVPTSEPVKSALQSLLVDCLASSAP
jgi:hypothetical protein